jgi:hypothetical protein
MSLSDKGREVTRPAPSPLTVIGVPACTVARI